MHLYEISDELSRAVEALDKAENEGDAEAYENAMSALSKLAMGRDAKLNDCAAYYQTLKLEADAIKQEMTRLEIRADRVTKRADDFKRYIGECLGEGNAWRNERFALSWRPSIAVKVLDEKLVPEIYWREKVVKTIDKATIGADLKIPGTFIPGAELEKKFNLQIK